MTFALVTGASSGIGEAFARRFASRGRDLVLVARRTDRLEALAGELRAAHGVDVAVVSADLAVPHAAATLTAELDRRGLVVDTVVNNAGFGAIGALVDTDAVLLGSMIALNCTAVAELCAILAPRMVAAGRGTIVNVSSAAAFQPNTQMAVYGATKSFVQSFTEALWRELHGTGVRVIAVCPGPIATEFFEVAGAPGQVGTPRTPEQVVRTVERGLRRGAPYVVDGAGYAVARFAVRFLPSRLLSALTENMLRQR